MPMSDAPAKPARLTWPMAAVIALLALQALALFLMGQPLLSPGGHFYLWASDPLSPEMSQSLVDWYSLTHIVHGIILFGLLWLAVPRRFAALRLLSATSVEVAWELAENSPWVIYAYRRQALAAGYAGDSIINSVSDTLLMIIGYLIASKLRPWQSVVGAMALEILAAMVIRDSLTLNVFNFVMPLQVVHDWQSGH